VTSDKFSAPKPGRNPYRCANGFFDRTAAQLVGLEPYRPGHIPVVFIHGVGSSSARWTNLINELQSDPVIREASQFSSFY
jgi:pimeloyl-ACP methyl ester carboxylesterase